MAPLTQLELDTLTTRIAEHLSETKYACSTLTRLTNGTTNFVFRGTLTRPVSSQFPSDDNLQGHPIETVIIKHTANFAALNKDLPIDISRCVPNQPFSWLNAYPGGILLTLASGHRGIYPQPVKRLP